MNGTGSIGINPSCGGRSTRPASSVCPRGPKPSASGFSAAMSELILPNQDQRRGLGPTAPAQRVAAWAVAPGTEALRRAALGIAFVVVAYHYSLATVLRALKTQTPLAYLGLVPIIALLLAAARIRPAVGEPAIDDRQLDYIIALPLLVAALAFNVLLPVRMSTLFWLWRLDVVTIPVFTAGVITLLFGVRTTWRLRIPIAFLILAWPLPYTTLLVNWLTAFTDTTLAGLDFALRFAPIASKQNAAAGTYLVHHAHTSFPVSVASACSGVNGIVGYLLVSVAFLTVVAGAAARKVAWLVFGLAGVWLSNVIRILMIVSAGHLFGSRVAIDVLHPFMGLVTFNIVVLAMVLAMPRFGLYLRLPGRGGVPELSQSVRSAVPKLRLAAAVLAGFTLLTFLTNDSLKSYDLVISALGAPRLASFSDEPSHPDGWQVQKTDTYTWATPFFGEDSTWYRYQFSFDGRNPSDLHSSAPVISDVINTSDVSTFSTYGIEACYRFHGFKLHSIRTVDLGGGVTGNVLAYYNTSSKSDWTTVYWHWPVKSANGRTRYERVTLMLINTNNATFSGPAPSAGALRQLGLGVQNLIGGKASTTDAKLDRTRAFLVAFAHELILKQATARGQVAAPPKH